MLFLLVSRPFSLSNRSPFLDSSFASLRTFFISVYLCKVFREFFLPYIGPLTAILDLSAPLD